MLDILESCDLTPLVSNAILNKLSLSRTSERLELCVCKLYAIVYVYPSWQSTVKMFTILITGDKNCC